jgi:hypothetical protein
VARWWEIDRHEKSCSVQVIRQTKKQKVTFLCVHFIINSSLIQKYEFFPSQIIVKEGSALLRYSFAQKYWICVRYVVSATYIQSLSKTLKRPSYKFLLGFMLYEGHRLIITKGGHPQLKSAPPQLRNIADYQIDCGVAD